MKITRPNHLNPIFKIFRRIFFCSRGKHLTYEGAYFCMFCSARIRVWDIYIISFNQTSYQVKASGFRHAVFATIEQYQLNVNLGDTFTGCEKKMLAFNNSNILTLTESDIKLINKQYS